jgi:transposase
MTQAKFKIYTRQQITLLPCTYEDKIAASHPIRIVDDVIEKIDLRRLYSTYREGGTSSYNRKMLLKAIIYAYITNIYSSREIEEAIKSDVRLVTG